MRQRNFMNLSEKYKSGWFHRQFFQFATTTTTHNGDNNDNRCLLQCGRLWTPQTTNGKEKILAQRELCTRSVEYIAWWLIVQEVGE